MMMIQYIYNAYLSILHGGKHFSLNLRTIQTITINLRGHCVQPEHYSLMNGLHLPLCEMSVA